MVVTSKNILYMGFTSIMDHFEDMGAMGFKKSHKAGGATVGKPLVQQCKGITSIGTE
jgi:hypothetical protein